VLNFIKTILLLFLVANLYAKERINIAVSILPQKTFTEKIAGEYADISVMVLPGASPATYEPKPSQMAALAKADLYFAIGVPFEKAWLKRFESQNPNMKLIHTQKGITLLDISAHTHHGHEEHDDYETKDPHVWLSPSLVKKIAENILHALTDISPEHTKEFEKNYHLFLKEIDNTDKKIRKILSGLDHASFMVFHPSWGYFAHEYNLEQLAIETEGKEPKPSQLAHFIEKAKRERVKAIFVQPEFSKKAAMAIAKEIGVPVVSISSLSAEWSENLINFAKAFKEKGLKN